MAFVGASGVVFSTNARSAVCRISRRRNARTPVKAVSEEPEASDPLAASEDSAASEELAPSEELAVPATRSFVEQIKAYFAAWSARDIEACLEMLADDCVIQDTLFPEPYEGKEAIRRYLELSDQGFPESLDFVMDNLTDGKTKVSARWHMELKGSPVPFSRGVSFWTASEDGLIASEYTIVEPFIKPGDIALGALKLAGPYVGRFL